MFPMPHRPFSSEELTSFANRVRTISEAKGKGSRQIKHDLVTAFTDFDKLMVRYALSPFIVFYINEFEMPGEFFQPDVDADPSAFITLMQRLASRTVTGAEAKAEIQATMMLYTTETSEVLARVLRKDLKLGVSGETINQIHYGVKRAPMNATEGFVVDLYTCKLAGKFTGTRDRLAALLPFIIENKYDGTRTQGHEPATIGDAFVYRARTGKVSSQYDSMFDVQLAFVADQLRLFELDGVRIYGDDRIVLDGETMASTWNETLSARGADNQDAKDAVNFHLYDAIPAADWMRESCSIVQLARSVALDDAIQKLADHCEATGTRQRVFKSRWQIAHTVEEAYAFYDEIVENNGEGAMIKTLDGLYSWGEENRDDTWMKWKPVQTYDGVIVYIYQGKKNKQFADMVGGVGVEGVDENGVRFRCRVGSGFTIEQRKAIDDTYIGKYVELEAAPDLHVEDDREFQTLKWGVFKKFRPDRD